MSSISIVSNEYITVNYLPDKKLIYHTIHQPLGDEQTQLFKDALNAGTDALKKYGATKWLSDDRNNGPLPDEILHWVTKDWNIRAVQAGWKYWANVVPAEVDAAGSLIPIIEDLHQHGLRMLVFTNLEEAFAWLDQMD